MIGNRGLNFQGMIGVGASVLDHVNFGPVLVELDLIHQLVNQKDPAAVIGI